MLDPRSPYTVADLDRCARQLAGQATPAIAAWRRLRLACGEAPWQPTGMELEAGQHLSWFCVGATRLKALPHISVPARFQLWARVGTGDVLRGTRASHSFCADADGALELGSYFPGEWSSRRGDNAMPAEAYALVEGDIEVLLIAWTPGFDASRGLVSLACNHDDVLLAGERARLAQAPATPAGWDYLWFLGPSESFHAHHDGEQNCIQCASRADAAILHHEAELPLLPDTRLNWRWCVEALPSAVAEDTLPSHDYLSIAVEFDNGLDLTYLWSVSLPVGTVFPCPLPNWDKRETHAVVRSGTADLGHWLAEQRDVYADYQSMIAPTASVPAPSRVLRVWLIAVSLFQQGEGKCRFGAISLSNSAGHKTII